jgi:hypothetical protein
VEIDSKRAFRDYVTRVSFNLSMTRNQIGCLREIVLNIEHPPVYTATLGGIAPGVGTVERHELRKYARTELGETIADNVIVGRRWLEGHGLIEPTKAWLAEGARLEALEKPGNRGLRDYSIQQYQLTEAGTHVVALLRLAGLLPLPAVNQNLRAGEHRSGKTVKARKR